MPSDHTPADESADTCRHPGWLHIGSERYCAACGVDRARMKVYLLRWWKGPAIHRQACLDCGRALDLPPICSDLPGQHVVTSPAQPTPTTGEAQ